MTTTPDQSSLEAAATGTVTPRSAELVLARVHLRLGSLALARAELETLAGQGALDLAAQEDLAEVRWRTGDLTGAGEAAAAALGGGEEAPIALAIAAEAAAALGRPNEARRLAGKALERVAGPIDGLFAGMPRAGVWPADAAAPPPTAGTLFHHDPPRSRNRRAGDADPGVTASRAPAPVADHGAVGATPLTFGFWDGDGSSEAPGHALPDPADELDAGRAALTAGSLDEATLRFALVLRLAPALAPAVLEATDGVSGATVNVVRGDAYRLVGLESEAQRAYAAAAWSGSRDRRGRSEPGQPIPAIADDRPEVDARPEDAAGPEADAKSTSNDPPQASFDAQTPGDVAAESGAQVEPPAPPAPPADREPASDA